MPDAAITTTVALNVPEIQLIAKSVLQVRIGDLTAEEMVTTSFLVRKLNEAFSILSAALQKNAAKPEPLPPMPDQKPDVPVRPVPA